MNLPNKLTVMRMALVPAVLAGMLGFEAFDKAWGLKALGWMAAGVLFAVAAASDALDGYLARSRALVTDFGKLMDPLADKVLVISVFVALTQVGLTPAWVVAIIVARELLVTGLRAVAARNGRVIAADRWGKAKTIVQMATLIVALIAQTALYALRWSGRWPHWAAEGAGGERIVSWVVFALALVCAATTIASGWGYLSKNRDLIADA